MNVYASLGQSAAIAGMIQIMVVVVCIAVAWWALQSFRIDLFLKHPASAQAKLLQILLSVVLGYQLGKFIIDYFYWSTLLKGIID